MTTSSMIAALLGTGLLCTRLARTTVVITATVVPGVVINLVANLVTNHFSWSLMIALVAATLCLIGAELWRIKPPDAGQVGRSTKFAPGSNPAADHTTRPATPPLIPHRPVRQRQTSLIVIVLVGVAVTAGGCCILGEQDQEGLVDGSSCSSGACIKVELRGVSLPS